MSDNENVVAVTGEILSAIRQEMSAGFSELNIAVAAVAAGQTQIRQDIAGLKSDISGLDERLTIVEGRLNSVDGRLARIEKHTGLVKA